MQNDENKPKEEHGSIDETAGSTTCLFSQAEITNIVKSFIWAWLRKEADFDFLKPDEISYQAKTKGVKIDQKGAHEEHIRYKEEVLDLISACTDSTKATPQQQQKALNELFQLILTYRLGDRLKGKFGDEYSVETRLKQFEDRLRAMEKNAEEIYFFVRTHTHGQQQLKE